VGDPVGDAQVGEFYELGGHAVQLEGFVGGVFPDDALGAVLLEPVLTGVGQIDFHHSSSSSASRSFTPPPSPDW